ncbi:hypothetical protein CMUST_10445 [Corynebacterium mustelae]|uniref:RelA/SpoT domain-containing protein n=1 Tax=Corynebacterium mustelae TaxID=571915 RepID=A0A0G3H0W8_9CORY|nr:GTP pyrophosphokinase [Corynebacterium mustelae]AKK06405.1 hypothetical protein CMUST_10445 [Corynebacterium mustelae]
MNSANISQLHRNYQAFLSAHPTAAQDFSDAIEDVLSEFGLTYDRISVRIKEWRSLRAKAKKRRADNSLVYPNPWSDIHDIIGVRITTYHSAEIPQIVDALSAMFEVVRSVDKAAQTRLTGDFGYGSHHLILKVDARVEELHDYIGWEFEVQIRTVLQHAWAEFEHDIRYKRSGDELAPEVDRAFTLAAGLIELADQQFDMIAAVKEPAPVSNDSDLDVEFSAKTLPGVLTVLQGNRFPQSRSEHYQWLEELLHANGITTVAQLKDLFADKAVDRVQRALGYRFQPGHVRIIDDLLLDKYGQQHIERTGTTGKYSAQRRGRLRNRLAQLKASITEETTS